MITEDYVSFETAKLLKEKGFNEKCHCSYRKKLIDNKIVNDEELFVSANLMLTNNELEDKTYKDIVYCSAPTLQMAMKWLREVHNITIGITFSCGIISYEIEKNGEFITSIGSSRTYEQIVEEAIQLCVKTLI